MIEGEYTPHRLHKDIPKGWDSSSVIKVHTEDGIRYRTIGEAARNRREAVKMALIGGGAIAATIGIPTFALKKMGVFEEDNTDDSIESTPEPQTNTWKYRAEWTDSYWEIVVNRYGDPGLESVLSFIESNVRNITAEGKREKKILEEGYPYMKEPLQGDDILVITNPPEGEPGSE